MEQAISAGVVSAIDHYPDDALKMFNQLRRVVVDIASETVGLNAVEETLKWNEPSYLTKAGSTVRFAWKVAQPDTIGVYFNCQTILVETFKELYPTQLSFDKNRAVLLDLNALFPTDEMRHCIGIAMEYHKLKNKPLLGG